MSQRIAYFRVSTTGQSIEAQRAELGGNFDREFQDVGVSGAVLARQRPGMAELLAYARAGDTVYVYAVDRLGRDSIDVQQTVRTLLDKGVALHVHGIGPIAGEAGKLVLALLAPDCRDGARTVTERTQGGRKLARETLRDHWKNSPKESVGRPFAPANEIVAWRAASRPASRRPPSISASAFIRQARWPAGKESGTPAAKTLTGAALPRPPPRPLIGAAPVSPCWTTCLPTP